MSTNVATAAQGSSRGTVLRIRVPQTEVRTVTPARHEEVQAPVEAPRRPERTGKLKKLAQEAKLSPTPRESSLRMTAVRRNKPPEVIPAQYEAYETVSRQEALIPPATGAGTRTRDGEGPTLNGEEAAPGSANDPCYIRNKRTIRQLTDETTASAGRFPEDCLVHGDTVFEPRCWDETCFMWKASALCHKPLYFEEKALERYGHSWGLAQPAISGAQFFATVPILPYKMGVEAPWECVYPLGYYRPGSCAPYMIPPFPVSVRGAAAQAGAVAGGILLIP